MQTSVLMRQSETGDVSGSSGRAKHPRFRSASSALRSQTVSLSSRRTVFSSCFSYTLKLMSGRKLSSLAAPEKLYRRSTFNSRPRVTPSKIHVYLLTRVTFHSLHRMSEPCRATSNYSLVDICISRSSHVWHASANLRA
jgi:hypothetical protein